MNGIGAELAIVVRSAGERTADYCCTELERQTGVSVHRVELVPFWCSLKAGLEYGYESGKSWVLSVDADVTPAPNAIKRIVPWLTRADAQNGVMTFMVHCKLFACARFMAIRVYRQSVLQDMLDLLPLGDEVRPESTTIDRLAERGWGHEKIPEVLGLHDYYQYYRDIYRKAFLHAQKHSYLAQRFVAMWRETASKDDDFRAALVGYAEGLLYDGVATCDVGHDAYAGKRALQQVGLTEKGPLAPDTVDVAAELAKAQASIDGGDVLPAIAAEQLACDQAATTKEVNIRLERIFGRLAIYRDHSPEAARRLLFHTRRLIPDRQILDTFTIPELFRYGCRRMWRYVRR